MDSMIAEFREDRHPSESYDDILNRDTRPMPEHMREKSVPDLGMEGVDVRNYYDPAYFAKEVEHVWMKVWQWACREEEIPNVGDYQIYEIVNKSILVVRTAHDEIKGFYNSCLHRGRKLATLPGCKSEFRCPYHGIAWNRDGSFKDNPIGWDFPQWRDRNMRLPEVKIDTWGGFVFINFDLDAKPLREVIQPLADHFKDYSYADRYVAVHVSKPVRCNWKVLAEAFMESHHSVTTHPQILPFLADANSQYDLLNDYVTRQFSASGEPSPFVYDQNYTPDQILAAMSGQTTSRRRVGGDGTLGPPTIPEGVSARAFAAEQTRQSMAAEDGHDYSGKSDAEMLDALLYNVWPHMSFWAGYAPNLVYRWRPEGMDPDVGRMDVMILKPVPKGSARPEPARVNELGIDEPWSAAAELGGLAAIFEQDMGNLSYVQEGLKASGADQVHFGLYSEMRIRQLHKMLARYMGENA